MRGRVWRAVLGNSSAGKTGVGERATCDGNAASATAGGAFGRRRRWRQRGKLFRCAARPTGEGPRGLGTRGAQREPPAGRPTLRATTIILYRQPYADVNAGLRYYRVRKPQLTPPQPTHTLAPAPPPRVAVCASSEIEFYLYFFFLLI